MIKLKDLLKELDFGKYPFTDPSAALYNNGPILSKLISRLKYDEEPNTKDEAEFIKVLSRYFKDEGNTVPLSTLKELLSIKSKFPGILDPTKTLDDEYTYAYRGTSIAIKDCLNYSWTKYPSQYSGHIYVCESPIKIKSKGTRGFSSFSVFEDTAMDFAWEQWDSITDSLESNLAPAVASIYTSNTNALFNPEFSKLINPHGNEGEVLYIGNSYDSPKTTLLYLDDIFDNVENVDNVHPDWFELAKHLKIEI